MWSHARPGRAARRWAAILVLAGSAGMAGAASAAPAPVNDPPNPYQTINDWAKMPAGRAWGSTSAVAIDRDGRSIWVAERCGANSCADSRLPSILKFDAAGRLVRSFGEGLLVFPHGIHIDPEGNVWVTDGQGNRDPRRGAAAAATPDPAVPARGHQVFKFSPEGRLLLTLGRPGGGREPDFFWNPNHVLVAPSGEVFVAEGHGGENSRILKFARDGRFLTSLGRKGSAPGEFNQPHSLAMDSRGRLFVADRGNNRIQIMDQAGAFIAEWRQFGRPSGLFIDRSDVLYAADSESSFPGGRGSNPGWRRGIRIGSAVTGEVTAFIPDVTPDPRGTTGAEGVAVDADGVVYGAEVGGRILRRHVRQ